MQYICYKTTDGVFYNYGFQKYFVIFIVYGKIWQVKINRRSEKTDVSC